MKTFFIAKKKWENGMSCAKEKLSIPPWYASEHNTGGKFEYLMMFFWQGKIFKNLRVNIEIDFRGEWENDDSFYRLRVKRTANDFYRKVSNFHFQKNNNTKKRIGILFNCHIISSRVLLQTPLLDSRVICY